MKKFNWSKRILIKIRKKYPILSKCCKFAVLVNLLPNEYRLARVYSFRKYEEKASSCFPVIDLRDGKINYGCGFK